MFVTPHPFASPLPEVKLNSICVVVRYVDFHTNGCCPQEMGQSNIHLVVVATGAESGSLIVRCRRRHRLIAVAE